ncbi:nicotinamide riboside transporter PnuC [Aliidiomarina maris]|uniref:Nicotinamide riboside transporter PnuC n=1 Tax=Aliidiomarina maris TaxID=531312 RepID=A0A327X617_9GAMM|nr:nicotinamide riboside transporter PnuC [Aliidiomarina maris]RAJ98348.1 nicotinamide mononucleotide transporter [Aliidiomarina maris]RUO24833.1 nicotinamide mononucleotide transporter [Aliidiomarina maris]
MQTLIDMLALTSGWELVAVALAVAYLLLAIRQSLWCWPAAAISASIYTYLFIHAGLLMESMLQVFYVVMAGYGYWRWSRAQRPMIAGSVVTNAPTLPVASQTLMWHARWVVVLALISVVIGLLLSRYTSAQMVWLDTPTTVFSLFATFLVARKVLQNWLYWIVIDLTYVGLFWVKGFYPTAILFGFYTLMAVIGYLRWRQDYQQQGVDVEPQPT